MVRADEKGAAFVAGLRGLDAGSPVAGLYLVGSHASGDVRPESDIEFLDVLRRPPQDHELSALAGLHERLGESWPTRWPCMEGPFVPATCVGQLRTSCPC